VPVSVGDLPAHVLAFGLGPYLVTVDSDRAPRTTSVSVSWHGDTLVAGLGTRTAANVRENRAVTLLWPAPASGGYALIVDGWAEVPETADAPVDVVIHPERAVLHVTRGPVVPLSFSSVARRMRDTCI